MLHQWELNQVAGINMKDIKIKMSSETSKLPKDVESKLSII